MKITEGVLIKVTVQHAGITSVTWPGISNSLLRARAAVALPVALLHTGWISIFCALSLIVIFTRKACQEFGTWFETCLERLQLV